MVPPYPPQAASPACTELETVMMDWLGKMLQLPEAFLAGEAGEGGGVIQVRPRAPARLPGRHGLQEGKWLHVEEGPCVSCALMFVLENKQS